MTGAGLRICRSHGLPDDHADLLSGGEFEMRQQARDLAQIWRMPMQEFVAQLRDPDSELARSFFAPVPGEGA